MMSAHFRLFPAAIAVVLCTGVGCKRQEISVYTAPKDAPAVAPKTASAPGGDRAEPEDAPRSEPPQRARPGVKWGALPAGWQQTEAGQVSAANFAIKSEAGEATVNITPLPNLAGREAMVVNMWRSQVGLPELAQSELATALQPVDVAGGKGQLFEIEGPREGKPTRIVTAMAHEPDASWFYKLSGDEAAVQAVKPVFLEWIKTVRVGGESGGTSAAAAASPIAQPAASAPPAAPREEFRWTVPAGWQAVAPGQMQAAKFSVPPAAAGGKAEVAVSTFPSDTGGTLANVNRWRRQMGLADVDEAGLAAVTSPLDAALPGAVLADLAKENRRMLGAIVPREGVWWFYKMTGDAEAVNAAHEAFVFFAKSAP